MLPELCYIAHFISRLLRVNVKKGGNMTLTESTTDRFGAGLKPAASHGIAALPAKGGLLAVNNQHFGTRPPVSSVSKHFDRHPDRAVQPTTAASRGARCCRCRPPARSGGGLLSPQPG